MRHVILALECASVLVLSTLHPSEALAQIDSDLDVLYIHRSPKIDYVENSSDPTTEGWPTPGQTVTWQAIIRNWSSVDHAQTSYAWQLDGETVASGAIDLPAESETAAEFPMEWTFDTRELTFILDPDDAVAEFSEDNNRLSIRTDAITIGYYAERTVYDYFHLHQHELGDGANSLEDWAQRGVRIFNSHLADAVYPETPEGVLDRFRIDEIVIVDDDSLPLVSTVHLGGGTITNPLPGLIPNGDDRSVDIQLGFPFDQFIYTRYGDHEAAEWWNPFYYDGTAFHEMGHARYLIDVYGFNVDDGVEGNRILITENGAPVVNTPYMPARTAIVCGPAGCERGYRVYDTPMDGLMNAEYQSIDRYSAAALNLIAGHRAVSGNFNAPTNLGEFMNDLPMENQLTVRNTLGNPLVGAKVSVYRSDPFGKVGGPYFKYYDDVPDREMVADMGGKVLLGRNPFGGTIMHSLGGTNAVAIVRVEHQGRVGYGFLESASLNLQYWGGNTELGKVELAVHLVGPGATATEGGPEVPQQIRLGANYPNPFSGSTTIPFELSAEGSVTLTISDANGRLTTTLLDDRSFPAGFHRVVWDARGVPSGTYLYSLNVDGVERRGTMVRIR